MSSFDDNKLSFKFHKNLSCLKVSRTLLKNDDALLEFGRMWRFLTGAGVHDHILDGFFDDNKLKGTLTPQTKISPLDQFDPLIMMVCSFWLNSA